MVNSSVHHSHDTRHCLPFISVQSGILNTHIRSCVCECVWRYLELWTRHQFVPDSVHDIRCWFNLQRIEVPQPCSLYRPLNTGIMSRVTPHNPWTTSPSVVGARGRTCVSWASRRRMTLEMAAWWQIVRRDVYRVVQCQWWRHATTPLGIIPAISEDVQCGS